MISRLPDRSPTILGAFRRSHSDRRAVARSQGVLIFSRFETLFFVIVMAAVFVCTQAEPYEARIVNSGFEDSLLLDGAVIRGQVPGWQIRFEAGRKRFTGIVDLPTNRHYGYDADAPEGENTLFMGSGYTEVSQKLDEKYSTSKHYEFSFYVGTERDQSRDSWRVALWVQQPNTQSFTSVFVANGARYKTPKGRFRKITHGWTAENTALDGGLFIVTIEYKRSNQAPSNERNIHFDDFKLVVQDDVFLSSNFAFGDYARIVFPVKKSHHVVARSTPLELSLDELRRSLNQFWWMSNTRSSIRIRPFISDKPLIGSNVRCSLGRPRRSSSKQSEFQRNSKFIRLRNAETGLSLYGHLNVFDDNIRNGRRIGLFGANGLSSNVCRQGEGSWAHQGALGSDIFLKPNRRSNILYLDVQYDPDKYADRNGKTNVGFPPAGVYEAQIEISVR